MLVVVNQPHIEGFRIEGNIPADILADLKKRYGSHLSVIQDEKDEDIFDDFRKTDFYREIKGDLTPAFNLSFYRRQRKMTQASLARILGVPRQVVCDMEHERRPISKAMAKRLAEIFDEPVSFFI